MNEEILLLPEQMSMYYMGYVDGMKWIIRFTNRDSRCNRPITDEEWEQFFESMKHLKKKDAAEGKE